MTLESFKPKALRNAEEYFKDVHMTQEQHEIFNDFVEIFLKHVPMGKLAAKGTGWRAVSRWQLEHKRDLLGLENEEPDERIKSIDELLGIVKEEIIKTLEDPGQSPLVDEAMGEIMDFYKDKYAYRE